MFSFHKEEEAKRGRGRPKLPPSDDSHLCWGAKQIGAYLDRTASQVYAMHRNGRLPTWKVGSIIVARKEDLDDPSRWPGQKPKKKE
jgi:hypothetical protein